METQNEKEFIRRGFEKERRNLLVTSIALFLVRYSNIKFQQISLLGNTATLDDPSVIHVLLLVLLGYFLLRFYTYYRDLPNEFIWNAYDSKFHDALIPIARKRFERKMAQRATYGQISMQYNYNVTARTEPTVMHPDMEVEAGIVYLMPDNKIMGDTGAEVIQLRGIALLKPHLRALFHFVFKTRFALEYILPFVIGLMAFGYGILKFFQNFPGR